MKNLLRLISVFAALFLIMACGKNVKSEYQNLPEDAVDLNDIFGKYDPDTDWNFTELDEEDWDYLRKLGIYWDDESGCYRKRSTEQAPHT